MPVTETGRTRKQGKGKECPNAERQGAASGTSHHPLTTGGEMEERRRTVEPHRARQQRFTNGQLFPETAPILASIPVPLSGGATDGLTDVIESKM
jgi:hypothetical protein